MDNEDLDTKNFNPEIHCLREPGLNAIGTGHFKLMTFLVSQWVGWGGGGRGEVPVSLPGPSCFKESHPPQTAPASANPAQPGRKLLRGGEICRLVLFWF